MSKGYRYPSDDFDAIGAQAGPRGVHRRPRSTWTKVWPFLLVLVLFPALAFAVVTALTSADISLPGLSSSNSTPADDTATDGATDAVSGGTDTATDGAPPASDAGTPEAEAPPAATANLAAPVLVVNSTATKGLAAKGAAALTAAGFTKVTTGNYSGAEKTSTVFYATADLEPTAQAAAKALGITTVTLDAAKAGSSLTAVLEKDYKP